MLLDCRNTSKDAICMRSCQTHPSSACLQKNTIEKQCSGILSERVTRCMLLLHKMYIISPVAHQTGGAGEVEGVR